MTFMTLPNTTMHIRRAVLPASPEEDVTQSSKLALLPLLSLIVVVLILLFFAMRTFRRSLYLPSFTWLRGKGKGAKGRLGLSGVELLPTSFKSIPTPNPSPFAAAFNLEGNAGKDDSTSLLSRSSSLDALPQFAVSSPSPYLTSRRHSSSRPPFSLPAFLKTKHNPFHRRSRSLGGSHRNATSTMSISAPPTPSPKDLLVDFSTSNSSTPTSASSDVGTHKLRSASPPLIPGLPIPAPSPGKDRSLSNKPSTQVWTFDVEDEGDDIADSHVTNSLLASFKRSQSQPQAKPQQELLPLIQYEKSCSSPPPTPSLVPKRLGTANPFASLADSFAPQAHVSARPLSPSPLSLSPSSPPGIEMMPVKASAAQETADLVDFGDDELEAGQANGTIPSMDDAGALERHESVDSLLHVAEHTHSTHVVADSGLDEPSETVSDPFDDSHAIIRTGDAWPSYSAPPSPSPVEQAPTFSVESALPDESLDVSPPSPLLAPASPALIPSPNVAPAIELSPKVEPEPLSDSWQWNGSWSPPSLSTAQPPSEWTVDPAPLSGTHDGDDVDVTDAGDDLMSFDNTDPQVSKGSGSRPGVIDLGIDVEKEMDPADTWFIEEPTAVWDASWTGEDVKGGGLFENGPERRLEDEDEFGFDRARQIDLLDELSGPSDPIDIHIFEEIVEKPFHEDSGDSPTATSNDIHDFNDIHDIFISRSNIASPIIIAATPLLSTPETPNTPLPELPLTSPVAVSPVSEEHLDPELLPLPDFPPIAAPVPCSPMALKEPLPSVHQAQTPTPPASPPPLLNMSARPLWSLRASDAPPLGLPATAVAVPVPETPVLEKERDLPTQADNQINEVHPSISVTVAPDTVDDHSAEDVEAISVIVDSPLEESLRVEERPLTRPTTPQLVLASLPGSFPSSPSPPSAALPHDVTAAPEASIDPLAPRTSAVQVHVAGANSNRPRTRRSAIDIALAMQLRPGLGAGADPAWMVRFLMSMFGWFAVLVSGELQ
ncbi:hypothetical protein DXG01_002815 [Tephrocybe rancida]|nr:hypothetical protein DXG01_002815 [Tephrocybe rancida]